MPIVNKEAKKAYARMWMKERRQAFFKNKYCAICGSDINLELDHINPAEKEHHRIWSWSEERRTKELAKCQILCSSCHQEKTTKENKARWNARPIVHGTIAAYYRRHCRCEFCLSFMKIYRKTLKNKKLRDDLVIPSAS